MKIHTHAIYSSVMPNTMTNSVTKTPRMSIYTAIVYNDLCIIMDLKQYDISLLHTHNMHAHA